MWKYTHTDEMYHSLTGRNNSTELYHSDTYLGQDFSDGVRHFKYIKREKVNGRWRYYYSHEEYNKAKSARDKAMSNFNTANTKAFNAGSEYNKKNSKAGLIALTAKVDKEIHKGEKNIIKKYKSKKLQKDLKKEYDKAKKEADEALKNKTKLEKDKDAKLDAWDKEEKKYYKVANKTKFQRALGSDAAKVANKLSDASYEVGKKVRATKKKVKAVKKKVNKKVDEGKKAVKKALKKAFPETHTSKTYHGDKVTITKSVNGKVVSKTTGKNKLTEKVQKRYKKEAEREEKKKKVINNIKKKLKR